MIGQLIIIMRNTKQKIFIVGCGGTGSNYIKELARYIATNKDDIEADVILIDGDVVEEKNLQRQSFIKEDILMNKAKSMALAVSDTYDMTFSYIPEYIASKEHMLQIIKNSYCKYEDYDIGELTTPIIIGCVDNHNCRKILHEIFEELKDVIYIDAANEFSTGEVVVGIKMNHAVISPDRAFYFPEILKKSKSVIEMSCTELNQVKPQHLVTNLFAANICLAQTIRTLNGDFSCGGIYTFDAFDCSCNKTDPNLIKH